jgi:tRNA pseudouridine65 synthase
MEILFQDAHYVAINKPSGLLVHRSMIDRHETRFAMQLVRDQIGQRVYPVHRLDKPTSGVLLFALDQSVAKEMGELFSHGQVKKRYLAIVRGHSPEQGEIDYPLKETLDRMTDAKADQDKPAQPAVTNYLRRTTAELDYPVGRYASCRYSLLELYPQTGRKHQIRRHLKHIFHPIVGDTTYGDGKHNSFFRQQLGLHRLMLAATGLSFKHPITGQQIELNAPLDDEYNAACNALGWSEIIQDLTQPMRVQDG